MDPLGNNVAFGGSQSPPLAAGGETIAVLPGEAIGELACEARNLAAALELYCGLIEEPGVLAASDVHYGGELRQITAACRRLAEKLAARDLRGIPDSGDRRPPFFLGYQRDGETGRMAQAGRMDRLPADRIENLAAELESKRNLLAALAGPTVALTVAVRGGALPVNLTREDLTCVLVNLVKNAVEAMPAGGKIAVNLDDFHATGPETVWLVLTVEDSGPGLPSVVLERILAPPVTARIQEPDGGRPTSARGAGLPTCRAIVEAAGGRMHAVNRPLAGARVGIELPAAGP